MTQADVIPLRSYDFSEIKTLSLDNTEASIRALTDGLEGWMADSLKVQSRLESGFLTSENLKGGAALCPDLPTLHRGSVDQHIYAGIQKSTAAADDGVADAERAFFVADLSQVYAQYMRWKFILPAIVPFYAVKCNPDPLVLRLLANLGTGFDCASHGEIAQVLSLGNVSTDRIIFANPCKAMSFITNARKTGVDAMTFDNADELQKISRGHPKAKLVLRILTDDSKSVCRLGLKFGASLETVPNLLARAKELHLDVVGISFHVGSGCSDPRAFADAISLARQAFDIGEAMGYRFSLLDVGGGFVDRGFESTATTLRNAIDHFFGRHLSEGLQVIAEPGRFFVSRAFTLATNVIARRLGSKEGSEEVSFRKTPEEDEQARVMYYINEGVYGAFNCILFDHQEVKPYVLTLGRRAVELSQVASDELRPASIWGPTCDSIDCVCPMTMLPSELEIGDWLGFRDMGAYTVCAASQFNGFERSKVVYTTGIGELGACVEKVLVDQELE